MMWRRAKWKRLAQLACVALPGLLPAPGTAHIIDVLVVYPQPAGDHVQRIVQWGRNWGETEMGPFLDANFARVNGIYQQSGIDVEFAVVHHQQVDLSYISPDWQATLSLALMNSELNNATYAPYIATIEALRDAHAADIVVYWRDFQDGGPVANGAGSIGGGEDEAYVHLTYGGIAPTVTSHEIGHLLGGQHSDGVQGTAVFSLDGDPAASREYRTIMTIAQPLPDIDLYRYVWRFSSNGASVTADVDCSQLTGSLSTCTFSSAASLGDVDHDVVPVLSAMVPVVAGFREAPAPVPMVSRGGQVLLLVLLAGSGFVARVRRSG